MKSPHEISTMLANQWRYADVREKRLLQPESWPLSLAIGKPSTKAITEQPGLVRKHLDHWRQINVGQVKWQAVRYRNVSEEINIPVTWELASPSEWVAATGSKTVVTEFEQLEQIIEQVDEQFYSLFIRQKQWLAKPVEEVIKAAEVALLLEQGCAEGTPLRAISTGNIDSKFFERHRLLIQRLLDLQFDGLASELGLEEFLGALNENNHWLLVADLDGGLLPFEQMRIRDRELIRTSLPGKHILIVENEKCLHQLPKLSNTIAILGAGLNLAWMQAEWLNSKIIGYWGDMDSWGLVMLARAKSFQPGTTSLLMSEAFFEQFEERAVREPQPAPQESHAGLSSVEQSFFSNLLDMDKGRLEQEFLPVETVHKAVTTWVTLQKTAAKQR